MRAFDPPRNGEDHRLRLQIGARTLLSIRRKLRRIAWSLDDVLAANAPRLPVAGEDGYLLTSLPETLLTAVPTTGFISHVRQRYHRYYVDFSVGEAAWRAGLSGNARAQLKRKAKRLGDHRIRRFRTVSEIAAFHAAARPLSTLTYQDRLLGHGLPIDPTALLRAAAADGVRAWLLEVDDKPVAYLCCTADGGTLRYDHVGHDPAWNDRSPGSVLQAAALADLFAARFACFARFDFTEGEGQHKRQLATGSVACVDLLLLRKTIKNRALIAALRSWDAAAAWSKRNAVLARAAQFLRR